MDHYSTYLSQMEWPTLVNWTRKFQILELLVVYLICNQILIEHDVSNSGGPVLTLRFMAYGLGQHCLSLSHNNTLDL